MAGPQLWVCAATTTLQLTILLYGVLRYNAFISFMRSASSSGNYEIVKNIIYVLLIAFGPAVLISITFTWIAYEFDWSSGLFFVVVPYIPILLIITVILITENDISNQVDVSRKARSKLPAQAQPAPFITVAPRVVAEDPMTPGRRAGAVHAASTPAIPIQDTPIPQRTHEL
jgi:hypothetical protein